MGFRNALSGCIVAISLCAPGFMHSQTANLPDAPSTVASAVSPSIAVMPRSPKVQTNDLGYLPPGADPENRLLSPFLKHIVSDQKQFWTSPFREQPKNFVPILGVLGGVLSGVLLIAFMLWYTATPKSSDKSPEEKLSELRAAEEVKLRSYDWIEKPGKDKPGVVRISAERAAELLLQEENKK